MNIDYWLGRVVRDMHPVDLNLGASWALEHGEGVAHRYQIEGKGGWDSGACGTSAESAAGRAEDMSMVVYHGMYMTNDNLSDEEIRALLEKNRQAKLTAIEALQAEGCLVILDTSIPGAPAVFAVEPPESGFSEAAQHHMQTLLGGSLT
jgi:hypothetical protein